MMYSRHANSVAARSVIHQGNRSTCGTVTMQSASSSHPMWRECSLSVAGAMRISADLVQGQCLETAVVLRVARRRRQGDGGKPQAEAQAGRMGVDHPARKPRQPSFHAKRLGCRMPIEPQFRVGAAAEMLGE